MITNNQPLPHRMDPNEQINPLLVFDDLFRNQTEFPVWRQYLYTWLSGIFSPDPVWIGKTPADMLFDLEQLERLLEAAWILHLQIPRPRSLAQVSEQNVFPASAKNHQTLRYWKWDFYPRWLDEDEIKQPYLVLDAFFDFLSLPQWIERFNIWLKQSLSCSAGDDFYSPHEILISFELLNKLLDATHLLYLRDLMDDPEKETLDQ